MPAPDFVDLDHDRFHKVDRNIFVRRVVADCMSHGCTMVADEGAPLPHPRPLLEACCQYGADTDLTERDAILGHADQLRALLTPAAAAAPWLPPGEMYLNESVALPRLTAPADHGSFWP